MKKYLVEFIGTFFLTFTIATAAVYGMESSEVRFSLAPLAIGLVLMVMTYAGSYISGAHYNPAVTLGVFVRGNFDKKDVAPYMVSQLLAAFVGGAAASVVTEVSSTTLMNFDRTFSIVLTQFLFTFALVFVFINSATTATNRGNSFYGLAVGGTYAAGFITVGGISLGSFNPAVSLMLAMSGKLGWVDSWMHFLPQILGGLFAGVAFKAVSPEAE